MIRRHYGSKGRIQFEIQDWAFKSTTNLTSKLTQLIDECLEYRGGRQKEFGDRP